MLSVDIADQIAWIRCKHKKIGIPSCIQCKSKFDRIISDEIGEKVLVAVAKYFEPETKHIKKITPLTWCQAYDVAKLVLAADRIT